MDIGSINSTSSIQNLNNLNNNSNIALNKAQLKYSIDDFKNNSSEALAVSRSSILKSEFSQDIQSINDGIAKSQISQASMDKLQDFMKNIQNKLENSQNYENKNDLKQEINQELRNFNQQAFDTKYKEENLIASRYNDEKESIQISSSNNLFSIDKPNVANVENALNKVTNTSKQLQELSGQFVDFSKQLQADAKNKIIEQNYNQTIDFGRESSNFSKANININAGYLAASQANVIQEQSVRLLS